MSAHNDPAVAGLYTNLQLEKRIRDIGALVTEHRCNMHIITERSHHSAQLRSSEALASFSQCRSTGGEKLTQDPDCTGGEASRYCAQDDTREPRREEEAVHVEVQHGAYSPAIRSFQRSSAPTPDSRRSRYEQDEKERGGMGAKGEDEESVYEYSGYTDWNQVDEMHCRKTTPYDRENGKGEPAQDAIPDAGSHASASPSPHLPRGSKPNKNTPTELLGTCVSSLATSFDFFPLQSTIVFPGCPPHIYQLPIQFTLSQIREILDRDSSWENLKHEPYILCALQIMQIREKIGVGLPNGLGEKVTIGIPDVSEVSGVTPGDGSNGKVKIAAWQASGTDDGKPSEPWETVGIDQSSLSDEDIELFLDLNDLIKVLDTDKHPQLNSSCVCDTCAEKGQTAPSKAGGLHPTPEVSFRGGGSSYDRSPSWYFDSDGSRRFPMISLTRPSTRPSSPNIPLPTAQRYATFTPEALHEIRFDQASNEPLSIRLGRLIFAPRLIRQRKESIRRFDWQHIKQLNPQPKDKSTRGFRNTKGPYCEDWAMQLDKHREHCEYCQAVFIEEELRATFFRLHDYVVSEDDAPMPRAGEGRLWEESKWPDDKNTSSLRFVEDQDLCLRGGAGKGEDLNCDSDDWRSERDGLARQIQCRCEKPGVCL